MGTLYKRIERMLEEIPPKHDAAVFLRDIRYEVVHAEIDNSCYFLSHWKQVIQEKLPELFNLGEEDLFDNVIRIFNGVKPMSNLERAVEARRRERAWEEKEARKQKDAYSRYHPIVRKVMTARDNISPDKTPTWMQLDDVCLAASKRIRNLEKKLAKCKEKGAE